MYYANKKSDDVIGGSSKTVRKENDTCRAVAMTTVYAAGPVLIKTKIPRFYLKQGSSTPNNLMGRGKTIWKQHVLGIRPCVPL